MSKRIAVLLFPGTNSEEETLRILRDCGGDAEFVHWTHASALRQYAAYVLPGGFAHEDRIRAGAIAAHDAMMETITAGAGEGKLVLGICNGAQILLEAGLAPGTHPARQATAAFTHNAPERHFICRHVYVKLAVEPSRCAITASLPEDALIPAWAAHGDGRLAAREEELVTIENGRHVAFVYARADGTVDDAATPNGSALGCAALTNRDGNVLAIMPHAERDAWNLNHLARLTGKDVLAPSGGSVLFESFVKAVSIS